MTFYIPKRLFVLNNSAEINREDPIFMRCMCLAFQWANEMGLQQKKVHSLFIDNPNTTDPMRQSSILWCKIECTKEEREQWEKNRELNIIHALNDSLQDDNANN